MLNSSAQTLSQYQSNLIALNNGDAHIHPMDNRIGIHSKLDILSRMDKELHKLISIKSKWNPIFLKNILKKRKLQLSLKMTVHHFKFSLTSNQADGL